MAEAPQARVWTGRLTFLAICAVLMFFRLLPLESLPVPDLPTGYEPGDPLPAAGLEWAMPDVLLATLLAWVMRRPDYVPALFVAGIMLFADLLFQRPPGLWAGLILLLSEFLRARSNTMRSLPFAIEWVTVSLGIVVVTVINRVILTLVDTPQAAVSLTASQMVLTCLIYPGVVAIGHLVFRVSRPAPGEVDALGHRL